MESEFFRDRGGIGFMGKSLIFLGVILIVAGILISIGGKIPFMGNLPGDIHFKSGNTEIYFPWVTCLLISFLGTIILNIFFRH